MASKYLTENEARIFYDAYLNTCLIRGLEPYEFLNWIGKIDTCFSMGWVSKSDSPNKALSVLLSIYTHKHVINELSSKTEIDIRNMPDLGGPVKNTQDAGLKYDNGKPSLDLLPTEALVEIAKVLDFGAKKYAAHNWRKGMKWSRLIGAAMRHITSFNNGEDKDPETSLSHLAHAGCCIMFLLAYEQMNTKDDDRYKPNYATMNMKIKQQG